MTRYILFATALMMTACSANGQKSKNENPQPEAKKMQVADTVKKITRTDDEWKGILTREQYHVLRDKGTDAPFTGKFTFHKEKGTYQCAGYGLALFTSDMKFDSNCGWPSFDKEIE